MSGIRNCLPVLEQVTSVDTVHNLIIANCNSIDRAEISLSSSCLNIKYGPNGIGKSTLAKAIEASMKGEGLSALLPFKHRSSEKPPSPSVSGAEAFQKLCVFNEDYVSQFVFQQDEVVRNSFNIFVRTADYDQAMDDLNALLEGVRKAFSSNEGIDQALKDLGEIKDAISLTSKGEISKSSKIYKAFGTGNKIENIPTSLQGFELFLKSEQPSKWIEWQTKGNSYLDLGDQCPYCSKEMKEPEEKEVARAVAKEYDATSINHLNAIKTVLERLGIYFSDDCQKLIEQVIKAKTSLSIEQVAFLKSLKSDIETLITKLNNLRNISFYTLRDVEKLSEQISQLKCDLTLMDKVNSDSTRALVDPLNSQLDELMKQAGPLQGSINKQRDRIRDAISGNEASINGFLKSAGYRYAVRIVPDADSYHMELVHEDHPEHIQGASSHLSYGEKNAFALVLFLHQVQSEKPDLVVLDDPISSFDKNKKFAILNELFRGKASLKSTTTLMLTHDIEPAIDMIRSTTRLFKGAHPQVSFLTYRKGVVEERPVTREDIQTFASICRKNIERLKQPILQAIYLRRHFEILDTLALEYNLLASLFKGRSIPTISLSRGESRDMTADEKLEAETRIKLEMPNFDYDKLLKTVSDVESLRIMFEETTVGYEKLQLFRLIKGESSTDKPDDDVVTKFVNETYHIENEYVMQLNPHDFDHVPEYVVDFCIDRLAKN